MTQITSISTSLSGTNCPACNSIRHIKNGKEKGNQKYRCKTCGKHFRDTTGSSIHKIHKKHLLEKYIECIYGGLTLRRAAIETGISLKTSFLWRHKLLSAICSKRENKQATRNLTAAFLLPYSEKGTRNKSSSQSGRQVKSIFQTDQTGTIRIEILRPISSFNLFIMRNISELSIPVTQQILPKKYKTVNNNGDGRSIASSIHKKLQTWVDKFHGVATKYLHHYWAWFEIMHDFEIAQNQQTILLTQCVAKYEMKHIY